MFAEMSSIWLLNHFQIHLRLWLKLVATVTGMLKLLQNGALLLYYLGGVVISLEVIITF